MSRNNDYDSSSYFPIYSAPYNLASSAYAQCHLIRDGFMCSRPPVGAKIVLFLSESPLIFYYAIKSICSSHKQLEIKWAPLKGMYVCVCVWASMCVCYDWAISQPKVRIKPFLSPSRIEAASLLHIVTDVLLSLKMVLSFSLVCQPTFTEFCKQCSFDRCTVSDTIRLQVSLWHCFTAAKMFDC